MTREKGTPILIEISEYWKSTEQRVFIPVISSKTITNHVYPPMEARYIFYISAAGGKKHYFAVPTDNERRLLSLRLAPRLLEQNERSLEMTEGYRKVDISKRFMDNVSQRVRDSLGGVDQVFATIRNEIPNFGMLNYDKKTITLRIDEGGIRDRIAEIQKTIATRDPKSNTEDIKESKEIPVETIPQDYFDFSDSEN